jgi:hypothetical protein
MARVFAVRVQFILTIGVSRSKHNGEPELSQGTQGLIGSR